MMGRKYSSPVTRGVLLLIVILAMGSLAGPLQGTAAIGNDDDAHPQQRLDQEHFDYVIVVANTSQETALQNFKTWKEQIGFRVKIVTLADIRGDYPSGDDAERIWNYLHDRYLPWGIRYVLLVGDIDQIPMRFLYPDGSPGDGSAYGTDYYYANLDVVDWDIDNDNRWGEFTHDKLDLRAEVFVGRIPFNSAATIQNITDAMVDFEQDTGAWKRNALLAYGFMDILNASTNTDNAVQSEMLLEDVFDPYGWTTTKLYEQSGLVQSTFASDNDLELANFRNACGLGRQGLVNAVAHGYDNGPMMNGLFWRVDVNNNGRMEPGAPLNEEGRSNFSAAADVSANPTSAVVFLCGCSTGVIFGDDPNFATSPLRSRYLNTVPLNGTMHKAYLENGAPVVIGSTAGADYLPLWDNISDGYMQSLNYLFVRNLIARDMPTGDAFYAALEETSSKHKILRGVRDFNFYGDPSLVLRGIEDRPGGEDVLVTESRYKTFAADYDDNGDMYVGVLVDNPSGTSSNITIYRSTNHGESWSAWTFIDGESEIIMDLGLLVSRHAEHHQRLLVVYTTRSGRVVSVNIDLSDPDERSSTQLADQGTLAKNISVARNPVAMPGVYDVYVAWEYEVDNEYNIALYTSEDNGSNWSRLLTESPYLMPAVDIGPEGNIYLAALWDNDANDVGLFQSDDSGVNWSLFKVLTLGIREQLHTAPDVAVSTDPSYPAVWVAYDLHHQDPVWGPGSDVYFAYSPDAGVTWRTGNVLSADLGVDEWIPDLAGYRSAPNRWVNLAYNADAYSATGYPRQIMWRYTSGGLPTTWSPRRIVNDNNGVAPYAIGPLVLYSPGSSVPGSGVVYGGENKEFIYFSAPWLPLTRSAALTNIALNPIQDLGAISGFAGETQLAQSVSAADLPTVWQTLGEIEGASSVTGLVEGADGALYAAAVVDTADGHEARLFRSDDHGQSWSLRSALPGSWSVISLVRLTTGELLAAGITLDLTNPNDPLPHGVIYRSSDNGIGWETILDLLDSVVYRLYKSGDGDLYVGTGWPGMLHHSADGGVTWNLIGEFGAKTIVRTILKSGDGDLWVGLEGASGGSQMAVSPDQGTSWLPVDGLDEVLAVNDLAAVGDVLYAATETASGGRIYRTTEQSNWSAMMDVVPEVPAFDRLYADGLGQLFATVNQGPGPAGTQVFRLGLDGEAWRPYHGWLDQASVTYDLLSTENGLYAATGDLYGNVYRVRPTDRSRIYLPIVQ